MKTILNSIPAFKRIFCAIVFFVAVNENLSAQCTPTFTYSSTNSSISLTSTTTGTTSTTNYAWNLSSAFGTSLYGTSSSYVFSPLYNGTYSVTLTLDSSTCFGSSTQTVVVTGGSNPPPCNPSFTYTVGSAGYTSFTNTSPVDPLGQTTYYWSFYDSHVDTTTFYYNGTFTVTLLAQNPATGCNTWAPTQNVTITNAHPAPPCTANFTYTTGAAGLINFSSLYTGTAPNIHYNWDFGNGNYDYVSSPSYTYPYNGTYTVTMFVGDTSNSNCSGATTQTISITNSATQPCTPTVTFSMHQDSMNPQPGIWQASSYYSPQVSSAVWFWGDGTSTVGFAPTHTYASAGQYSICVTVYSACGDSSTNCQFDSLYRMANNSQSSMISVTVQDVNGVGSTAGIKANTKEHLFSIYPNPNEGLFLVQMNRISFSIITMEINIMNILGGLVYNSQERVSNNFISKEIDLQNLSNGAYFMRINVGDKTYSNKIIISR